MRKQKIGKVVGEDKKKKKEKELKTPEKSKLNCKNRNRFAQK